MNVQSPLDPERLAAVFLDPDEGIPEPLVSALYLIREMASPAAFEELVALVRREPTLRDAIDLTDELTPLDLAVQVYLRAPAILEHEHAERFVDGQKAFESYVSTRRESTRLEGLTPPAIVALERDLGKWFASQLKGEQVRVFSYARTNGVAFLVQHGEAFRRERAKREGALTTVFYRPEKNDVLLYDQTTGELRVNATTKGEKDLYRRLFGLHLFGSEDHFQKAQPTFTLAPLLERSQDALVCTDVPGLDWVSVVEVAYLRPAEDLAKEAIVEVRIAKNAGNAIEDLLPGGARLVSARFRVKFSNARGPRHVTLRLPNVALFTREDDGPLLTEWLRRRGFVVSL